MANLSDLKELRGFLAGLESGSGSSLFGRLLVPQRGVKALHMVIDEMEKQEEIERQTRVGVKAYSDNPNTCSGQDTYQDDLIAVKRAMSDGPCQPIFKRGYNVER